MREGWGWVYSRDEYLLEGISDDMVGEVVDVIAVLRLASLVLLGIR